MMLGGQLLVASKLSGTFNVDGRVKPGHDGVDNDDARTYEHPVVDPHVSHFMQVPLRTSVKLPHSLHISPS
jgi:hypothetical protein